MKFISNPDKFVFFVGISIIGFIFMFTYILLNQFFILIPLLVLWIIFSVFILRRNYIEYIIQGEKIVIRTLKVKFEINLNEIKYIVELTNYTNLLREKRNLLI